MKIFYQAEHAQCCYLIKSGLGCYKSSFDTAKNDHYRAEFFNLVYGLEKLIKLACMCKFYSENGHHISKGDYNSYFRGHNLASLLTWLSPSILDDLKVKLSDELKLDTKKTSLFMDCLLDAASHFWTQGKYDFINIITSQISIEDQFDSRFLELRSLLLPEYVYQGSQKDSYNLSRLNEGRVEASERFEAFFGRFMAELQEKYFYVIDSIE